MHSVEVSLDEFQEGRGTPVSELWDFLLKSRFIYPEKLAALDVEQALGTWAALLRAPAHLARTFVSRQNGAIVAHACAVRVFTKTWMLQHLAALPGAFGRPRGQALSVHVVQRLSTDTDADWFKIWYRPANRYPVRVFGSFAERVAAPGVSELQTYDYLVGSTEAGSVPPASRDIHVRAAERADCDRIFAHLPEQGHAGGRDADDLTASRLVLQDLGSRYAALGLERRREVLVAERGGELVGFALLEISSIGLNLSELTSAVRVWSLSPRPDAKQALITTARRRYAALGRRSCIVLAEAGDRELYEQLGFCCPKQYTCWTLHRSRFAEFCRHLQEFSR
jgi:hypothetical protein